MNDSIPLAQAFQQPTQNVPLAQAMPMMPAAQSAPAGIDPTRADSYRYADPSQLKGLGFFGPLKTKDGKMMTEYSIGTNIDGKDIEIPSVVPTLTKQEIDHLLGGGEVTDAIFQKALEHAKERMKAGLPVFATDSDKPFPVPQ